MKIKVYKLKNKIYNPNKINFKHNLWRIENDLNWFFLGHEINSFNTKMCLYWLDINLKNSFFPWILKIERELKSFFIHYYKLKFLDHSPKHLINQNNYEKKSNMINPCEILIKKNLQDKTVDEVIFSLTFGEFVNLTIYFNSFIKSKIANDLNLQIPIFINLIKFLNILRNSVAHNKTIIKIKDEKKNKRFSLKKDLFDFKISKEEIDILSTNISGSIYVLKILLEKIDSSKKSNYLLKDVKKNLKTFKKTLNNNSEYKRIMRLLFLDYSKEILKKIPN